MVKQKRGVPGHSSAGRRLVDQQKWDRHFVDLQSYKNRNGHCDVPHHSTDYPSLGSWVCNQRTRRKVLSDERTRRLEEIGFRWGMSKKESDQRKWDERYQQLKSYHKRHGDCNVPKGYVLFPQLGEWVCKQRQAWMKMPASRVKLLQRLNFNWGKTIVGWEERLSQLKEYKREHGDCDVPARYSPNPQLGKWVTMQRHSHKKRELDEDRVNILEDLGFNWVVPRGIRGVPQGLRSWGSEHPRFRTFHRSHIREEEELVESEESSDDDDDGRSEESSDDDDDGRSEESSDDDDDGRSEESSDDDDDGRNNRESEKEEKIKRDIPDRRNAPVPIGEVGYTFRKQFDDGWYTGEVVKIRPGATRGKDRRCRYTDGDEEDLSMLELQTLAELMETKRARTKKALAKLMETKRAGTKSNAPAKPNFCTSPRKIARGHLNGTETLRQQLCPKVCDKSLHDSRA
ncbi:hypothetical protein ACHAXR_006598 [Thalassiosira sp. AJA248-18]